jgi:hypothetical protein
MRSQWQMKVISTCLCLFPCVTLGQVAASIEGRVQDTSGALIPGVTVTVKNLETSATRTVPTADNGSYRALSLPVGPYEVAAEKSGFRTQVQTGINLVVGQDATVNLTLEVGEVQTAVTVTSEAPIVNTTTASTSGLVTEQQVKDLPLNGRSFDNLITLDPGTSNPTAMKSATGGMGPGNQFNISGQRGTDNLFLLNGIEYVGSALIGSTPGGASGQLLGIDAVREFNVQSTTYGAEYGKRPGGQITVVTASGTNELHGAVFEFLRNSALDARNFFDHPVGQRIPPFRRNQFGGALGGPIKRNKVFIFGNYEGYRQALTSGQVVFVPDANARQGLLPCGAVTPAPNPCPASGLANVGVAPGMAPYFALWPAPNGPVLGGGIAQAFAPAANPVREDFGTLRVDQFLSEKDSLSESYTIDDGFRANPATANPVGETSFFVRSQVLSLQETHSFSPSVINVARAGFSRAALFDDVQPTVPLPASLSIFAGEPMGNIQIGGGAFASSAISAYGTSSADQIFNNNLFTYTDSVQITRGKHTLNVGASLQRVQSNTFFRGSAYGSGNFVDLQHLLQGVAAFVNGQIPGDHRSGRQWNGAWYVSDTIKVLPRLTLTLGLRHEFTDGWNVYPLVPVTYVAVNGVLQTQPRVAHSMFTENNTKRMFGPRIGLAWDVFGNGKTSLHAGFGTYYSLLDYLTYAIPGTGKFQLLNVQFPFQIKPGQTFPGALITPQGIFPPDPKTPTVQEWSMTVEQGLSANTVLSVGYVGSRGYHILGGADENPAQSVICPAPGVTGCTGLSAGTKFYPAGSLRLNPSLGSGGNDFVSYGVSRYNSLQIDLRQRLSRGLTFRTNYSFSKAQDNTSSPIGPFLTNCPGGAMDSLNPGRDYSVACYNVANKFAFSGSYALPFGRGQTFLRGVGGVADRLVGGWKLNGIVTVQSGLPFTPIVGFGNSRNGNQLILDRPILAAGFNRGNITSGTSAGCAGVPAGIKLGTPTHYYDPCAFLLPPAGTYGNLGRNPLTGPGLSELDLSLFKDIPVTERFKLQFRAELFNVLNHANFGIPSASLFSASGAYVGSAGVIANTITTARQIQFGLKLLW